MSLLKTVNLRLNGVYTALKQAFKSEKLQTEGSEIATYYDGNVRTITPQKLKTLLDDADNGDISAMHALFYEIEEQDPHIFSEMQKRKNAVLTLDWTVKPPVDATPKEIEQTQWVHSVLTSFTQFEDVMLDALDGIGHGFSALEILWTRPDQYQLPAEIYWRPQSWFKIDKKTQELRLIKQGATDGEPLKDCWIVHRHKTKSGLLARSGLYRVLAWTFAFKHYSVSDFAEFLEIYGLPPLVGKYPEGTSKEGRRILLNAVASIGHNTKGIMPDNMFIEALQAASGSHEPFLAMINYCERAQSKVILGGTLTSQADGKSSTNALGTIHNEVRHDLLVSDAKQLAQTLTSQLIYPLLARNFPDIDVNRLPYFEFDTRKFEDLEKIIYALNVAVDYADITEDDFYNRTGLTKPAKGDKILTRKGIASTALSQQYPIKQLPYLNHDGCNCSTVSLKEAAENSNDPQVKKALLAQHQLDGAIATLPPKYVKSYDATVLKVVDALRQTNNFEEAQGVLYDLMPELDNTQFSAAMGQALLIADVAGKLSDGK